MTYYQRSPVTEAVFALQFRDPLRLREVERIRDRLKARYPKVDERLNIQVEFNGAKSKIRQEVAGFQVSSATGVEVAVIETQSLTTSRLAPYTSWENLIQRSKEDFLDVLDITRPYISRVGARFINRIDIPERLVLGQDLGRFFLGAIHLPPGLVAGGSALQWQMTAIEATTGLSSNLAFALQAPSPLLEHVSFVLDIDIFKLGDIPIKHEDMWAFAESFRTAKNKLFEALITDEVRSLIN